MHPDYTSKDLERFWKHIDKSPHPKNCWVWTAGCFRRGYGAFTLNYKTIKAHRFSFFLANGEYPDDLQVLHECDNPSCVNPDHLFLGTHQQNVDDCVAKKRHTRGEIQGLHKLTWEAVVEIRRLYAEGGISQQALGDRFGVKQGVISAAILKKTWKD